MSMAQQRYLLAQRLPALAPGLAFQASHPARPGQFRIDIPAGLEAPAQQAWLRDQQVVAALGHPHVLPLVEASALPDGTPITVSRWPEGTTLQARLDVGPPLPPGAGATIIGALADALAAAHAQGIGHGAVGADQVLLGPDGASGGPWLFGFGARHLLGQAPEADVGARDRTDLAALADLIELMSAAPAVAAVAGPVEAAASKPATTAATTHKPAASSPSALPEPELPVQPLRRSSRRWIGLGAGAFAGAALTAFLMLPSQAPPELQVVAPAPAPPPRAPAALKPPPPRTPPIAVERPERTPAPPAAAPGLRASTPRPAVQAVRVAPPPPRPAPEAPRRGLVWSARAQRLVHVDELGLALEQPAAPAPAAPAPDAPAPQVVQ